MIKLHAWPISRNLRSLKEGKYVCVRVSSLEIVLKLPGLGSCCHKAQRFGRVRNTRAGLPGSCTDGTKDEVDFLCNAFTGSHWVREITRTMIILLNRVPI